MNKKKYLNLSFAKKDILSSFEKTDKNVFSRDDIEKLYFKEKEQWRLSENIFIKDLIEFLIKENVLKEYIFEFPNRKIKRYSLGEVSLFKVVSTIREKSYFTHYSAIYLHQLTEQFPKTIYLNYEQSIKPRNPNSLSQENINKAFSNNQRETNNFCFLRDSKIVLLNGMYTGNIGLTEIGEEKETVTVTNLERTIIDITVRPNYSGGVYEVLKAYKNAKDKLSVNRLTALLKKLDYVYPYYQAIGFYLEKAGYNQSQLNLLKQFDMSFDFYLTHKMKDVEYSKEWRLFFPKGF